MLVRDLFETEIALDRTKLYEADLHHTLSGHYASIADDPHAAAYINGASSAINNRYLGKGSMWSKRRDQRTTAGLLGLIDAAAPLRQPLRVFSNTGTWNALAAVQNNTLVTKPFTSTSLDYNFVFRFGSARTNRANVILQFDLPAGYHQGVYLGHHSAASANQQEFVLAPNQTWKVVGQRRVQAAGIEFTILELTP